MTKQQTVYCVIKEPDGTLNWKTMCELIDGKCGPIVKLMRLMKMPVKLDTAKWLESQGYTR